MRDTPAIHVMYTVAHYWLVRGFDTSVEGKYPYTDGFNTSELTRRAAADMYTLWVG